MFIGTALAPDLANDFALMHELNFLKVMLNRYLQYTRITIEPLHPLEFIEQYGNNNKRFIAYIPKVAPGLPNRKGPTFNRIIKREGGRGDIWWNVSGTHLR